MQNTRPFVTYLQICRYISSSNVRSNFKREARFIKNIIYKTNNNKTKKIWFDTSEDLRNATKITNATNKSLSVHTVRRMTIRNKLFMKHITDLMSMGELSDIINGSIEITHVKITPDFKYVNVFWTRTGNSTFISEEALQKCAKIIRHELSQLRVIGMVPFIQFVENKQFSVQQEIEKRLEVIECEEDSESVSYSEQIQLAALHITFDQTLHRTPDMNHDTKVDENYIELPPMRHDVLGLDHYKIMSQIVASLSKSRAAVQRRLLNTNNDNNNPSDLVSNEISNEITNFLTQKEQRKIFSDFLMKRKIEEKRRYRTKQLREQKLLENYEDKINSNEDEIDSNHEDEIDSNHEDEIDSNHEENDDKYSDDYNNEFECKR